MSVILRPHPMLGPVEAMRLRGNFDLVVGDSGDGAGGEVGDGVIIDLTGVRELSGAGLAAVTSIVTRGRRSGVVVRVLLPEDGSEAARVIDQADLGRFLRPGGVWNPLTPNGSMNSQETRGARRAWLARHLHGAPRRTADWTLATA